MGVPPSFRQKSQPRAPGSVGPLPKQRLGDGPPLRLSGGSRNPGVGRCGAHPDANPFPRRHHPRYPSLMHSRTDKNERPPQGDAPAQPQVVFLSTPPTPDTGCFPPAQNTRNETNPTSGGTGSGGRPRLSGGSRNPGRGEEAGHTLTRTPFHDDHIPATLPPCTTAFTTRAPAPKGDAPSQPQVVFLSTPPTPDTGCFLPAQKTRNETNPTSGRVGGGGAPASSFP